MHSVEMTTGKSEWLNRLADVNVLLGLMAIALLIALFAITAQHSAAASSRLIARRWALAAAAFLSLLGCMTVLVAGLLVGESWMVQASFIGGGVIVAAVFVTAIRMSIVYESEFVSQSQHLADARRALSEYQTNLEAIVARRTQALRREIEERRRVQQKLSDAVTQRDADLRYARDMQQALLAPPPQPAFADVAVTYQPMASVSGDTYSFHHDDSRISVLLADAMGHGVSAALLTQVVLAGAIRMLPFEDGPVIFEALNRMLSTRDQEAFVTASWLRLESGGRLSFCGAGNTPLLVWRATAGRVTTLDGAGLALGMFADIVVPHEVQTLQLEPGDRIYLMTDGLLEWAGPEGEQFGLSRLEAAIQELSADPLPESVAGLQNAAWEFAQMQACGDDATLIALEYRLPAG